MKQSRAARHEEFLRLLPQWIATVRALPGYLSEKEMKALALFSAFATADGEVLEIGSFKGKSTSILALASRFAGLGKIVAVDPLTYRPHHDPLKGKMTVRGEFDDSLRRAQVEDCVEFHQKFSYELSPEWKRKLRLLWIDGDHSVEGARKDFALFYPHLADGAIVALHDTMKYDEGPIRVFMEDMLLSPNFGAAGMVGSIGWAQFRKDPEACRKHRDAKMKLWSKLADCIPFICLRPVSNKINHVRYQYRRTRVPHGELPGNEFFELADFVRSEN